jgi:hypothetical protein
MTQYLITPLKEIVDTHILTLIVELEQVTRLRRDIFLDGPLIHFLQQCVRPNGAATKQILITKDMLDSTSDFENLFLLRKQIKKLSETQIYWLCVELARLKKLSIENCMGTMLYVLINKCLKEEKRKKKRKPRNLYR